MVRTLLSIWILFGFMACKSERNPPKQMLEKQQALTILEYNQMLVDRTSKMMQEYVDSSLISYSETGTGLYVSELLSLNRVKPSIDTRVEVSYKVTVMQNGYSYAKKENGLVKTLSIKGIKEAVQLMEEGEKAQLLIPPHLAFGIRGDGNKIVPAAVLIVELQLIKIY